MKKCTKSGSIKDISEFYKNSGYKDGYHGWCKACYRIWKLNYKAINREFIRQQDKEYRKSHREGGAKRQEKYRKNNPDKIRKQRREQYERNMANPTRKLFLRTHTSICNSLAGRKHGKKWESLVGYDIVELKQHLEKMFVDGMSWDNYGQWHVDHIIPSSVFNFSSPDDLDFKRCWDLKNLRPMWGTDNIKKGAKLSKPFQPALAIAV